jgi:hypothetical protein
MQLAVRFARPCSTPTMPFTIDPASKLGVVSSTAKRWSTISIVIAFYFFIAFGRIIDSFNKLASDPSYDFVDEIYRLGLKSFVSGSEGYIQIGPRFIAYIAHFFPVQNQAIVLSALTTLVFALLAFAISSAIALQTNSRMIGFVCGLCLILVPAATESTVGNHGSVKWSIVVATSVVFSSPKFVAAHTRFSIGLASLAILCSPLAILALSPLYVQLIQLRRQAPRYVKIASVTGLLLTTVQFLYWSLSGKGAQIYGGGIQYRPWDGMGQFWWSIILTPPVFIIGSLIFVSLAWKVLRGFPVQHIFFLCLSASLITASSYITTGIKDSTAVAWQSLSWILSVLVLYAVFSKIGIKTLNGIVILAATFFFGKSAEMWYPASWYLSESKVWSLLVQDASNRCEQTGVKSVSIELLLSTVEMPCSRL